MDGLSFDFAAVIEAMQTFFEGLVPLVQALIEAILAAAGLGG